MSFRLGIFPSVWKKADVCPVPKCKPVCKDQLRPISLLPIVSKLFEKIILKTYSSSLICSYDKYQFAYRPESSTVCALLFVQERILKILDDSDVSAVRLVTFDMSRAFDCVPHHLLLSEISKLSLPDRSSFVNWVNSYLSDRQQKVRLGNTKSSLVHVSSGVPQGSVLGPVLFSLYMSSYAPSDDKVYIAKYADDITLILPVYKNDIADISNFSNEVKHFVNWCAQYEMQINHAKTKVLNINFSKSILSMYPGFENVREMKVLGLFFNDRLSWSTHFEYLIKKASQRMYVLRILKPIFSHDNLVMVFYAITQSLFDYPLGRLLVIL